MDCHMDSAAQKKKNSRFSSNNNSTQPSLLEKRRQSNCLQQEDIVSPTLTGGVERIAALRDLGAKSVENQTPIVKVVTPTETIIAPSFVDPDHLEQQILRQNQKKKANLAETCCEKTISHY